MELQELLRRVELTDEVDRIEVKTGEALGKSARETISAFANEPGMGGGHLVFGVRRARQTDLFGRRYEAVGVSDPDKLQSDMASACASEFSAVIRPEFQVESVPGGEGRALVASFVPEAPDSEKPVFIKARGEHNGSFRRIGPTDQKCRSEDFQRFALARAGQSEDEIPQVGLGPDPFDEAALARYRQLVGDWRSGAPQLELSDERLLRALHAVTTHGGQEVPTLAGLLLFGRWEALRRQAPAHRIDYIRVPGNKWVPDPARRYDSVPFLASLLETLPRAVRAVMADVPKAFALDEGELQRRDVPRIPELAVREAIVNAVAHRDYRVRQPIQIIRFDNRLEIRNPGFSLKNPDDLGEPGSLSRNEHILEVLQETRWAEAKGTGVAAMRAEMKTAGLAPPFFDSNRTSNQFIVRFSFHHFLNEEDWAWLARFRDFALDEDDLKALLLVREMGQVHNAAYRDLNDVDTLTASQRLRRLCEAEVLEKRGRSVATHYVFGIAALRVLGDVGPPARKDPVREGKGEESTKTREKPTKTEEQSTMVRASRGNVASDAGPSREALLTRLPESLAAELRVLPGHVPTERMQALIVRTCEVGPHSRGEIATLLSRNEHHVRTFLIRPLLKQKRLRHTIPDEPRHRDQRYVAPGAESMGRSTTLGTSTRSGSRPSADGAPKRETSRPPERRGEG